MVTKDEEYYKNQKGKLSMNLGKLLPMLLGDMEIAEEAIENLVRQYKPVIYSVLREGFHAYTDLVNNDEYFIQRAQMKRKHFTAYKDAGFSDEQAMLFILDSDAARTDAIKQFMSMSHAIPNIE